MNLHQKLRGLRNVRLHDAHVKEFLMLKRRKWRASNMGTHDSIKRAQYKQTTKDYKSKHRLESYLADK